MRGAVISLDPAAATVVVKHEPIPGVMPAMTMPLRTDAATLKALAPGREFAGRMESHDADWWRNWWDRNHMRFAATIPNPALPKVTVRKRAAAVNAPLTAIRTEIRRVGNSGDVSYALLTPPGSPTRTPRCARPWIG